MTEWMDGFLTGAMVGLLAIALSMAFVNYHLLERDDD